MVVIINGEIVPDDDPRARARRKPPPQRSTGNPRGGAGWGGQPARINADSGSFDARAQNAGSHPGYRGGGSGGGGQGGGGDNFLQRLGSQVGLEGTWQIPAVAGFPATDVDKVYIVLFLLLTYMNWRAGALGAILYFAWLSNKQ